ncbi:hypothetical protein KEM54_006493 [Ascosphaera aggregata]|nr:hypothetical protein KEM54_006493 [Ascosphaera aggregata]
MAIFINSGPAAVLYPLGAIDHGADDVNMTDNAPSVKITTSTTATGTGTRTGTGSTTAFPASNNHSVHLSPHHPQYALQVHHSHQTRRQTSLLQRSRAAHTSCRRLESDDERPTFTNPSHKRSRDTEDDDDLDGQDSSDKSCSTVIATADGTTAGDNNHNSNSPNSLAPGDRPIRPRSKKLEIDHSSSITTGSSSIIITTRTTMTQHVGHVATITEPIIAHQGWPMESPHFTEERIYFSLGVGWRYLPVRPGDIGGDPDFIAATRGRERFIENHYQQVIGRARIFLERNEGDMYLVAATPPGAREMSGEQEVLSARLVVEEQRRKKEKDKKGQDKGVLADAAGSVSHHPALSDAKEYGGDEIAFYLFRSDLSRARLIGASWGECVHYLNQRPIGFPEGSVELVAQQTPVPLQQQQQEQEQVFSPTVIGFEMAGETSMSDAAADPIEHCDHMDIDTIN